MDIFGFIFGLLVLVAISSIAIVGLGIFGITKIVQTITNRLSGKTKQPRQIPSPQGVGSRSSQPHSSSQTPRQQWPEQPAQPPATPPRPKSYVYLDVDRGSTAEDIAKAMHPYESQRVTGFYAREIISTLDMADLRKKSLFSELDRQFSQSSISWDHFASTATEALDTILRNCALLANRVQGFDVDDYERMEQFYRTGGEMRNGKQDPARIKRWELLRETKDEMDKIRSANEALLLELDKLTSNLSKISSTESTDDSARIADEVSRLAEETKYYH